MSFRLKKILLSATMMASLTVFSHHTEARTLTAQTDWAVQKVNAETPYCTLSRSYQAGAVVTIAKNANGEATLALDFQREAFDVTRPYPVVIQSGNQKRNFAEKAAVPNALVLRLGSDQQFLQAMVENNALTIMIDNETFTLDLSGYNNAVSTMNQCLGIAPSQAVAAANASPTPQPPMPQVPVAPVVSVQQNQTIDRLIAENQRLTQELLTRDREMQSSLRNSAQVTPDNSAQITQLQQNLAVSEQEKAGLLAQIETLQADLVQSRRSLNPDLSGLVQERDAQIALLTRQNRTLQTQLEETRQRMTEIASAPAGDVMPMRLAEAETQAKIFKAERDELQKLLQQERLRAKTASQPDENVNMIADIQRLEKEKAELKRELAFVQSNQEMNAGQGQNAQMEIRRINTRLLETQEKLNAANKRVADLQTQLVTAQNDAKMAIARASQVSVAQLARDDAQGVNDNTVKTLRSEIAALEAQNNLMRRDVMQYKSALEAKTLEVATQAAVTTPAMPQIAKAPAQETFEGRISRPVSMETAKAAPRAPVVSERLSLRDRVAETPEPMPQAQRRVAVQQQPRIQTATRLSGSEIKEIIRSAQLPLMGTIDRIDRVSGPDFAAFRWDTGTVFGSGEQSRLVGRSAFNNAVTQYINKTRSRCTQSFDQTVEQRNVNGLTIQVADIACVDNNAQGAAASIVFFAHEGMFYALAHEADMNSFQTAMDMRDRLASHVTAIF
jgi:LysM repeat protein